MIYVMSDIHGEYEKYKKMLDTIQFSKHDILYILGDVVDRGNNPIPILQDMMLHDNIIPILGNHDYLAYTFLSKLMEEITEDNYDSYLDEKFMEYLSMWKLDGGQTTIDQFYQLSNEDRKIILEYISEFSLYECVYRNNNKYILVHAGLGNYSKDKSLREYTIEELCFERPDYTKNYFEDESIYVVCGHTPVQLIHGKGEIYKENHFICMDCGAVFQTGKLACLCLDTMEEYYIE